MKENNFLINYSLIIIINREHPSGYEFINIDSNMALLSCNDVEKLLKEIEENQIGYYHTVSGPFGSKRRKYVEIIIIMINIHSYLFSVVYTDYTASGR